jgi:Beta-lactamase
MFFSFFPLCFAMLTVVSLSESFQLCPLLGPTVPVPTSLPQSSIIQQTLQNITISLDQAIGSKLLGIDFNTTSFGVSIFSIAKNSTPSDALFLWQYQHTAPSLKDASSGVQTVNADSIYRIGSLTKLFTVLTILINAGDSHWDQPITMFLPELASAAKLLDAEQAPVVYVNWNDITLGNLAGHMAGIGRDCKIDLAQEAASVSNGRTYRCPWRTSE